MHHTCAELGDRSGGTVYAVEVVSLSPTYTQVKCIVMQGVSGHSATSVFITQRIELCGAMLDQGSGAAVAYLRLPRL